MSKDILITGVTVIQQMKRAKEILKNQVIPKEKKFQKRKKNDLYRSVKENYDIFSVVDEFDFHYLIYRYN